MYTNFPLYPTSIFSNTDYPAQADNTDTVYAALINALKTEIQACFDELGTLPKGFHISVKARIEALEAQFKIVIDYMEYATDELAQAAYITDAGPVYGSDVLTGGTGSADSNAGVGYEAAKAFDDSLITRWASENAPTSHWVKYDLGVGVTKTIAKLRLYPVYDYESHLIKAFKFEGSNNDSDWTELTTGECSETTGDNIFTFSNSTAYRYFKVTVTSYWAGYIASFWEVEGMEITNYDLQCYTSIEKEQGDHSLKVEALITNSLGDTLTRTVSPVKDLTGKASVVLWARSDRTGENFKVEYHDSGGNTIEYTIEILVADTWEKKEIDISAVDDADKDAIDQIKYTVLNADSTTIIYLDDNYSA